MMKARVVQPTNFRQRQTQQRQEDSAAIAAIENMNVYANVQLSAKRGSLYCIWKKRNRIIDLTTKGFDEAVGRTRFAGKLNIHRDSGCSRLLQAHNADELEAQPNNNNKRGFDLGQRALWWGRLVVDIFNGPVRCRLCSRDGDDPEILFATTSELSSEPVRRPSHRNQDKRNAQRLLNGLAIDVGAHLTSKLQLGVNCLKYFDPVVTVTLSTTEDDDNGGSC